MKQNHVSGRGGSSGGALGQSPLLKPTKVTLFTIILYNSENNIRDTRPFCRPMFYHCSVEMHSLLHLSYSSKAGMRFDY